MRIKAKQPKTKSLSVFINFLLFLIWACVEVSFERGRGIIQKGSKKEEKEEEEEEEDVDDNDDEAERERKRETIKEKGKSH